MIGQQEGRFLLTGSIWEFALPMRCGLVKVGVGDARKPQFENSSSL